MKRLTFTIILLLFSLGFVKAQEAKLDTVLRTKTKPKVKVIYDIQSASLLPHQNNDVLTWNFNSKTKVKTVNPIFINYNNVDDLNIDKATRSLLFKYKIEKPEIVNLYELASKYCKLSEKDILFSVDDEWQKQPDSTFISIDAIKHVRVVDSKNYPYLSEKKDGFVVMAIKTVNPPKKEEAEDGKPKIYIR
ncbi:MAG: hypothetical protein REI64_12020 [Pedobacter sp.]|uniref:hypothetical protein n=1 Tax=Pedobacter sp. TaxID=1411316 RepID=UPI002807CAE0|nr:hypothetical protein [Pedobacter sp.]MDQ8005519.1 hypothetical protein [Pedobacter sp.]